jgi:hypothetical protein
MRALHHSVVGATAAGGVPSRSSSRGSAHAHAPLGTCHVRRTSPIASPLGGGGERERERSESESSEDAGVGSPCGVAVVERERRGRGDGDGGSRGARGGDGSWCRRVGGAAMGSGVDTACPGEKMAAGACSSSAAANACCCCCCCQVPPGTAAIGGVV